MRLVKRKLFRARRKLSTCRIHAVLTFALLLAAILMVGCVTVSVGPKGPDKASDVKYVAPSKPFEHLSGAHADAAWQSKETGNTIGYLSSCNDSRDPSLVESTSELFAELNDQKIISQNQTTFDNREALDTEVEGRVEGIDTRVHALVFKKNDCMYTLSYIGLSRVFDRDREAYEKFKRSFVAP